MYNCNLKKTWKFLSAAALTFETLICACVCGAMLGKLGVVVVTMCVLVDGGLKWQADESVGVYRDGP